MTAKPVVAGTDGSEESLQAVDWAAREAALRGAPLLVVSVPESLAGMMHEDPGTPDIETVADVLRDNRDHALDVAAQRAAATAPGLDIDTGKLSGPIAQVVTDSGTGAAMLVVGSRGRGAFAALVLGSVSRFAATHASCPVVVVRDAGPPQGRPQLGVGIRDADTGADALAFAFEEAALRGAGLTVIHALHVPHLRLLSGGSAPETAVDEAATRLSSLLASWRDKYPGVQVSQQVLPGHAGRALAGLSAHADLVIIGRRAPQEPGTRGAGAVTHALLNHAHGPVVTVPSS